jgi:hypothetical protein
MYFSNLLLAAASTASFLTSAYSMPVEAAVVEKRGLTAEQVVTNIDVITTLSKNLQAPANNINILSGPLFLIGQGPFPVSLCSCTIGYSSTHDCADYHCRLYQYCLNSYRRHHRDAGHGALHCPE